LGIWTVLAVLPFNHRRAQAKDGFRADHLVEGLRRQKPLSQDDLANAATGLAGLVSDPAGMLIAER